MPQSTNQLRPGDQLPPNHNEAEQAILGCCLLAPEDCIADVEEVCGGEPEFFYDLRHQALFEQLLVMRAKGVNIDLVTVPVALKDAGLLEAAGGRAYVASLPDMVASPAMIRTYLGPVNDTWRRRKMIQVCSRAIATCYEMDKEDPIDGLETEILAATAEQGKSMEATSAKQGVTEAIDWFQQLYAAQGKPIGIPTGLTDIDKLTLGICETDLWVLAGRPATGKTALALTIAEHVAVDCKLPVAMLSLEMPAKQLMARMMASRGRVNARHISDETDFAKLTSVAGQIAAAPLWIQDRQMHIGQIKAWARRMVQRHKVKLIIVDYLQLIPDSGKSKDRQSAVAAISNGLKQIALNLRVPVIALAQLNREIEKGQVRKPKMSDLRESGSIEQDADLIGLLWNRNPQEEEQDPTISPIITLTVAKQRNGPVGDAEILFRKQFTRFENAAKTYPKP